MRKTLDFSFGSIDKTKPGEDLALGKYKAAIDAVIQYAEEKSIQVEDTEKENVFAEMCRRQVGNIAYGHDHALELPCENDAENTLMHARVEAFNYADYSIFGSIKLIISGESELVEKVNYAWENANPLAKEEISKLRRKFKEGKVECYGYCKR